MGNNFCSLQFEFFMKSNIFQGKKKQKSSFVHKSQCRSQIDQQQCHISILQSFTADGRDPAIIIVLLKDATMEFGQD